MWKTLLNQAPKKEIYVSENKEIKGEAHHEIIFPSKMLYEIVTNQGEEIPVFWILGKVLFDLHKIKFSLELAKISLNFISGRYLLELTLKQSLLLQLILEHIFFTNF